MPNDTTNPPHIEFYYTQEKIDSLINEKSFDTLIEYSPYLTIKLIKDNKINSSDLTYNNYFRLATLSQDSTTCSDINDIVSRLDTLNDAQKGDIEKKSKEIKEVLKKDDSDRIVEIFKSSMKPKKKEEGMETDYGDTKGKPDPLSTLLKRLYMLPPTKEFIGKNAEAREYFTENFTANARKFIEDIASKVESGLLTPETNPDLNLLQQAFCQENRQNQQNIAIRDITNHISTSTGTDVASGVILIREYALPILAEELWKNKTMEEAITDGENQVSGGGPENYFNSNSAYFRDYLSSITTTRLAASGERNAMEPNAPLRITQTRSARTLSSQSTFGAPPFLP